MTISLGKYYKKAYKRGISLKLFETKKGAAAKKAAQPLDATKPIVVLDDGEDIPPEEDEALAAAAPVGASGEGYDQVSEMVTNPLAAVPEGTLSCLFACLMYNLINNVCLVYKQSAKTLIRMTTMMTSGTPILKEDRQALKLHV